MDPIPLHCPQVHVHRIPPQRLGWNRRQSRMRKGTFRRPYLAVSLPQQPLAWYPVEPTAHHRIHFLRPHLPRLHLHLHPHQ